MFADPLSLTINAVATPIVKTGLGPNSSKYVSADGNTTLEFKQTTSASRFRHEVRISQQKISADPISALNVSKGVSVYLVVDEPKFGFSDTEIGYLIDALKTMLSTGNQTKILQGEY